VGTVLIDVLFAAVMAKALDLSSASHVNAAEQIRLGLAGTTTVTAWIGYHNSRNRARYSITFFNLPLLQFTIEIGLVYLYWLLVIWSARVGQRGTPASIVPETTLLACVFILNCSWDLSALTMRKAAKYQEMGMDDDRPLRRRVTRVFLAIFVASALAARLAPARLPGWISVLVTVALAVLVVAHRWLQNVVQHPVRVHQAVAASDAGGVRGYQQASAPQEAHGSQRPPAAVPEQGAQRTAPKSPAG
jgi:hypothetical protein